MWNIWILNFWAQCGISWYWLPSWTYSVYTTYLIGFSCCIRITIQPSTEADQWKWGHGCNVSSRPKEVSAQIMLCPSTGTTRGQRRRRSPRVVPALGRSLENWCQKWASRVWTRARPGGNIRRRCVRIWGFPPRHCRAAAAAAPTMQNIDARA